MSDSPVFNPNEIPSIETIEYGRAQLENEIAKLRRSAANQRHRGLNAYADQSEYVANWIERFLLGKNGAVIRPFDKRYLDPDFRRECEAYF